MATVPTIPPGIRSLTDPKFLGWLQDVIDQLNSLSENVVLPSGTSVTTDEAGELSLDTDGDGSAFTQATMQLFDGSRNLFFFGVDAYPTTDKDVIHFNATNKDLEWKQIDLDTPIVYTWFGIN